MDIRKFGVVPQILVLLTIIIIAVLFSLYLHHITPLGAKDDSATVLYITGILESEGLFAPRGALEIHPPLYPLFVTFIRTVGGRSFRKLLITSQTFFLLLGIISLYFFSQRYVEGPWRLLPPLLLALNPQVLLAVSAITPLVFLICMLTFALSFYDGITEFSGTVSAFFAGIFWGGVVLTEPVFFYFPLIASFFLVAWKRSMPLLIRHAIFLLVYFLTLFPWALRNMSVTKEVEFLPQSTTLKMYAGASPVSADYYLDFLQKLPPEPLAHEDFNRRCLSPYVSDLIEYPLSFAKGIIGHFFELWNDVFFNKFEVEERKFGVLHFGKERHLRTVFVIILYFMIQTGVTATALWAYSLRGLVREMGGAYPYMLHSFTWYFAMMYSLFQPDPQYKLLLYPLMSVFTMLSLYYLFLLNTLDEEVPPDRMRACLLSMVLIPVVILHRPFLSFINYLMALSG